MNTSRTKRTRINQLSRVAFVASAGLVFVFTGPERSVDAVTFYRDQIGISAWERVGITGKGAVIGNLSGLPPLISGVGGPISHRLLNKSNPIPVVFENDGIPRLNFSKVISHSTATAGAMVASGGGGSGDPKGITPDAQLLVGWFAIGFDNAGNFTDRPFANSTVNQPDAIAYSLFAMADQDIADALAGNDRLLPYTAATVINSSFGLSSATSRRGEDQVARIYNAVVSMTDATLVASTSDDAQREETMSGDPDVSDLGTVYSPGAAHNTISVGFLNRELDGLAVDSGVGPSQGQNQADVRGLYPMDDPSFMNPFTDDEGDLDSVGGVFVDARPGVDIVAPGELLTLPGSTFGDGLSAAATDDFWIGSSFSSAIVSSAAAMVHELGRREGHSISALVTKAVLLNSADKDNYGFNNMQVADMMDPDRPLVTEDGLDEEIGGGALDLRRLLVQYHLGTIKPDYLPGDGLNGLTRTASAIPALPMTDSFNYNVSAPDAGTDPNLPFVSGGENIACTFSLGGFSYTDPSLDEGWQGIREVAFAQRYGPFSEAVENMLYHESAGIRPMARRDDPDLGDGDRGGDVGDGGTGSGGGATPPAGGGDNTPGGGGSSGVPIPYRTGWDHGNLGEGFIDLPIGVITPGSGISITLAWNRHEHWDTPPLHFVTQSDIVSFNAGGGGDGGGGTQDPMQADEVELENIDLELWRENSTGRGDKMIAASRSTWNNTECIFISPQIGLAPGTEDGVFGFGPANYYIRIKFNETLYDYGGFSFCNGGEASSPKNSEPADGFNDMNRAQVEYAVAWYVDFNLFGGEFFTDSNGAVLAGIKGLTRTTLSSDFIIPVSDINADLLVDADDAALLIQNFGSLDPSYDLNNDGIADAMDLEFMSQQVGQRAIPRNPTREEKKAEKLRLKDNKKAVNSQRKLHKKTSKKTLKEMKKDYQRRERGDG